MKHLGEITAESTPDYDNWGPDYYWSCAEWVAWHKALKARHGREVANNLFKIGWDRQGTFEHGITACRYDSQVVEYFMSEGIDIRSFLSAILLPLFGGAANVAETAETATTGIDSIVRTLKTLLPLALVVTAAGAAYYGYNKYIKSDKK